MFLQENSSKKHFCEEWTRFACKWSPNYSVISDPERSQYHMRDATRRDVMLTKQAHVTNVWLDSELRDVRNRCKWRQRGSESTKLIKMASTVDVKRFCMQESPPLLQQRNNCLRSLPLTNFSRYVYTKNSQSAESITVTSYSRWPDK